MGFFARLFGCPKTPIEPAARRAVLVGINEYSDAPLAGCVNDIYDVTSTLKLVRGYVDVEIRTLLDGDATTKNIVDALKWLAAAEPGAMAYLHFSGHGTQVPTSDPSEADGLSEVVCPVDFDWSPERMISDKEFMSIFRGMKPGVLFNWTSDSCHSGDLERSLAFSSNQHPIRPRTMSLPPRLMATIKQARAHKKMMKARGIVDGKLDVGFASGCRSDQTSADTYIDGKPCGAMSYYFLKTLRAAGSSASLSSIIEDTRKQLSRSGYDQIPQVEGARARKPFLG